MSSTAQISTERLREIYAECGGDLVRVADVVGIPYPEFVVGVGVNLAPPPPMPAPRRRKPPADLGREPVRQFIISARHCDNPFWPLMDREKIESARDKYEAGTHEMVQGRDGEWFYLCLIPRKKRTAPRKFFHALF